MLGLNFEGKKWKGTSDVFNAEWQRYNLVWHISSFLEKWSTATAENRTKVRLEINLNIGDRAESSTSSYSAELEDVVSPQSLKTAWSEVSSSDNVLSYLTLLIILHNFLLSFTVGGRRVEYSTFKKFICKSGTSNDGSDECELGAGKVIEWKSKIVRKWESDKVIKW